MHLSGISVCPSQTKISTSDTHKNDCHNSHKSLKQMFHGLTYVMGHMPLEDHKYSCNSKGLSNNGFDTGYSIEQDKFRRKLFP